MIDRNMLILQGIKVWICRNAPDEGYLKAIKSGNQEHDFETLNLMKVDQTDALEEFFTLAMTVPNGKSVEIEVNDQKIELTRGPAEFFGRDWFIGEIPYFKGTAKMRFSFKYNLSPDLYANIEVTVKNRDEVLSRLEAERKENERQAKIKTAEEILKVTCAYDAGTVTVYFNMIPEVTGVYARLARRVGNTEMDVGTFYPQEGALFISINNIVPKGMFVYLTETAPYGKITRKVPIPEPKNPNDSVIVKERSRLMRV